MPKTKDPLAAIDIDIIRKWIAQGAKDDTPATARDARRCRASADLSAAARHHFGAFFA